jgi:hypothetical protein
VIIFALQTGRLYSHPTDSGYSLSQTATILSSKEALACHIHSIASDGEKLQRMRGTIVVAPSRLRCDAVEKRTSVAWLSEPGFTYHAAFIPPGSGEPGCADVAKGQTAFFLFGTESILWTLVWGDRRIGNNPQNEKQGLTPADPAGHDPFPSNASASTEA